MSQILVIETADREICSVTEVDDIDSGVAKANELLKSHMEDVHHEDDFENETGLDTHWAKATVNCFNAWCNHGHVEWDAHIVTINPPVIGNIVRVVEEDADGCGTDLAIFVQFDQIITKEDADLLGKTIREVKSNALASGDPYDTLDILIDDAIECFQVEPAIRKKNLSAHIVGQQTTFNFEVVI